MTQVVYLNKFPKKIISFKANCVCGHLYKEIIVKEQEKSFHLKVLNPEIVDDGNCTKCGRMLLYTSGLNVNDLWGGYLNIDKSDEQELRDNGIFWRLKEGMKEKSDHYLALTLEQKKDPDLYIQMTDKIEVKYLTT